MKRDINKFKGEFTIVDTDVCQFEYSEYLEYCKDMDIEAGDEHSEEFWQWCYDECENNYENDMYAISDCDAYNHPVRINGKLGLWDGKHKIEEVVCESVHDAIEKCNNGDYEHTLRVKWHDGIIKVSVAHHDGVNYFEIVPKDRRKKLPYLYAV